MNEPKTILVIDDSTELASLIEDILTNEGYKVVTAHNGLEGLEQLKKIKPHLIVLDMNMPKMGGISFYAAISTREGKSRYPVLVLTAREQLSQLFKDLKVDGFMTKPLKIQPFLAEVHNIMSRNYDVPAEVVKIPQASKKILIIEEDKEIFEKIIFSFLHEHYVVSIAQSGVLGIEKAMADHPDAILIQLGLSDLPGDLVASKLRQMPKTMDIPLILYTSRNDPQQAEVANKICDKIGIQGLVLSAEPSALLKRLAALA